VDKFFSSPGRFDLVFVKQMRKMFPPVTSEKAVGQNGRHEEDDGFLH